MANQARHMPLYNAAKALDISEAEVLTMEANGEIGFQMNGNVKEYNFNFDPNREPKFIPVPPEPQKS